MKDIAYPKVVFLDGDGTLYMGDELIPGAKEFLISLNSLGIPFYLSTNNSSKTASYYADKCQKIGLPIHSNELLISTIPACRYLVENSNSSVYIYSSTQVREYCGSLGVTHKEEKPDALLLTYYPEYTDEEELRVLNLIEQGLPFYATHPDRYCPSPEGPLPDLGLFLEKIKKQIGKEPDYIFGKPNKEMFQPYLPHDYKKEDVMIIGDRLYTDIQVAKNLNVMSVLTLTGETTIERYQQQELKADFVVSNLLELLPFFQPRAQQSQD